MRFSITKLCGVFFALGLMLAQSCSHLTEELPTPASDQSQSIIAKAQVWFNQTEQGSSSLRQSKGSVMISWQLAVTSGAYVVVPLADTTNLFGSVQKHGYRYLVVQNASLSDPKGRIVELILAGPLLSHRQAAEAALAVAKPFLQHASPIPTNVPGLTGYALIYSAAYYYQAGMEYEQGVVLNKRVSLRLERKSKDADATALKVDTPATASFIDNASFCMVITTCGTVTVGDGNG